MILHKETFQITRQEKLYALGSIELTINTETRRVPCAHANVGSNNELYEIHNVIAKTSEKSRVEWTASAVFNGDGSLRMLRADNTADYKRESISAILVGFGGAK